MEIKKASLTVLIAVASTLITMATFHYVEQRNDKTPFETRQMAHFANYTGFKDANSPGDFTYAAGITTPAVVHIKTKYAPRKQSSRNFGFNNDPMFRQFFGDDFFFGQPQQQQPEMSSGSGVIISDDGYIITNNHVIENGSEITVVLADKREYKGEVVGTDPNTDLALVKIPEKSLPYIVFGNSDSVKIGQWVLAVGNPFNLESTVTAGIVSAKARNISLLKTHNAVESYIQTDAAVNPGNSGGALVNTRGELVGINSAISTPTGAFAGYAFAIPVNIVKKVANDLLKYGKVERAFLGINPQTMTGEYAKARHVDFMKGVYVDSVFDNSSAAVAGLRKGDIITMINGTTVATQPELTEQVSSHHPGDKITVTYLRNGSEHTVTAALKGKESVEPKIDPSANIHSEALNADFSNLSGNEMKQYGITGGVKVDHLEDGKLTRYTDMHDGFIITKIDGKPVGNVNDLKKLLDAKTHGGTMIEGFYPDNPNEVYYYAFGM